MTTKIVVLGAGYAGLLAAIGADKRTRRDDVEVTLVNPLPRFTERLRMHQMATGQTLADHQITDVIAGTRIRFVQGFATSIEAGRQRVVLHTADGQRTLSYDTLVYAVGSTTDTATVAGVDGNAFTLNSPEQALAMAVRLREINERKGSFIVCGGGLTGIEAATEIAESHPDVRVVLVSRGTPGAMMGPKARAHLERTLTRLGVEVRSGTVTKVLPEAIELNHTEYVRFDGALWTTGVSVSQLAARSGIATDGTGRVITDGTLRSVSHPSVWAVGDAAAIRQAFGVLHGTCQSGMPSGAHVAEQIARVVHGKPVKKFRFGYIHQPVSLGRKDAVIQFTHADDTPRRWFLKGRAAIAYKEFVSGSPITTYRLAKRLAIPARALASTGGRRNPSPAPHVVGNLP